MGCFQLFGCLNIILRLTNNLITVFTITYNCEQYVDRCYKSILNQTYQDWIWLIIDDGSNDRTEIFINKLNDDRIHYHKIEVNVGRGKARNYGLSKVQSDWLAILDMDDLMLSTRLEKFNDVINSGSEGLISSTLLVDKKLEIKGIRRGIYNSYFNLFTHATLCINTSILKSIGYSESRYAEDQRVIVLAPLYCKLENCEEPFYIYQEDASINIQGAYLSNLHAFFNLKSIQAFSKFSTFKISRFVYLYRFGIRAIFLFLLSKVPYGDIVYDLLIQKRTKDSYEDAAISKELNLYE